MNLYMKIVRCAWKMSPGLVCLALLSACSTSMYDEYGGEVSDPLTLSTGDLVRVFTKGYEDFRFVLLAIHEDRLEGGDYVIAFSDIRNLEIITPKAEIERRAAVSVSVSATVLITAAGLILLAPDYVPPPSY